MSDSKYYAELCRTYKNDKQTLGQIDVIDGSVVLMSMPPKPNIVFTCFSLELPDKNNDGIADNEVRESCIPDGEYEMTLEDHPKFGWCYRLHNVPGRSGVLMHSGTNFTHTLGCILPGTDQKDLNKDGELDNTASKAALAKLVEFKLTRIKIWTRP